jgi:hypothetical protein
VHRLTTRFLIALLIMLPRSATGQRGIGPDNERKAEFVYRFILFVHWPADAFRGPSDVLRVQIIGRDPFDGSLDRIFLGKSVDDHRVVVTHADAPITAPLPHVVFVSATKDPQLAAVLAAYCRAPVLTVSDLDRFANRGGVIGLVEQDHELHFAINQTAASEARLQVSAQLFHLAVHSCPPSVRVEEDRASEANDEQQRGPSRGRADLKHLRAMTEAEIRPDRTAGAERLAAGFLEGCRRRQARSARKRKR